MMHFATGPTHENAGGIFLGNGSAIFILYACVPKGNHVVFFSLPAQES